MDCETIACETSKTNRQWVKGRKTNKEVCSTKGRGEESSDEE